MTKGDPPRPFVESGDLISDFLPTFWQRQVDAAENEPTDFRHPALPLARIKKVMKSDPDVKVRVCWSGKFEMLTVEQVASQMIASDGQ
jgi:nuclear transcription factor Y, gamma